MKKRLNEWVYEWLETYKKVMVKTVYIRQLLTVCNTCDVATSL